MASIGSPHARSMVLNAAKTKRHRSRNCAVVVDTVSPQIEFSARPGEGGEVRTTWQLFDQNLLASSLKIEYQEEVSKPWKPVSLQLPKEDVVRTSYQGQTTWWPETQSATINIRAEVRDRAGNLGVANRRLLLPALVAQRTSIGSNASLRPTEPFSRFRQSNDGAIAWPSDNRPNHLSGLAATGRGSMPLPQQGNDFGSPAATQPAPRRSPPPGPEANGLRTAEGQLAAQQTSTQFPAPANHPPANTTDVPNNANAFPGVASRPLPNPGSLPPAGPSNEFAADRQHVVVTPTAAPLAPSRDIASMLPPGERPQMTNSPRFHLEYDVDAVGPAGVAEVQLWATADAGHTWRLWGTDEDLQSPFDVAVEEEGIFGFHVVVVGKNGMSGRRPRTGDLADIWVGVDTTVPTADLIAATYGEGAETGKLLIRWRAADENLDPRPITLSFSESRDGPWTVIVSALPNNGQFSWPADPQLPSAVYLKLEVRDLGGNVAADRTDQPVQIDGLAPKARIRGVQPMQDMDREAFRLRSEGGRG